MRRLVKVINPDGMAGVERSHPVHNYTDFVSQLQRGLKNEAAYQLLKYAVTMRCKAPSE